MSTILSFARPGATAAPESALAFVTDAATGQLVAESLPGVVVREDGLGAALGALSQGPVPSVLIVDLGDSKDPAVGIRGLARIAGGRTRIIALGGVNDIALYRALREAGAVDYLVKPVTAAALSGAVARLKESPVAAAVTERSPRRLFVCGARGGAGATTFAVNVAWHLSHRDDHRVALIDLDLAFGTVALALDVEPSHGLRDILENPDRIDGLFVASAAARVGESLSVFAAEEAFDQAHGVPASIEVALGRLCEALADNANCVVVDVPRHLAVGYPGLFKLADRVALVSEMSLSAARDAARLGQLVQSAAPECPIALIANKCGNRKGEIDHNAFGRGAKLAVDHFLPFDAKSAAAAANAGQAIGEAAPSSPLCRAIAAAADDLVPPAEGTGAKPLWKRLLRKG